MQATQCSIDGCTKPAKARSWCGMHWYHWRQHGDVNWEPQHITECTVEGCAEAVAARGLCSKHRARQERTGTTDLVPRIVDYAARFWAKVDQRGPDECWLWNGTILSSGYGQFWCPPKKHLAHRFAYELVVGPIPDGLTLDHVKARGCTNRNCVNPAHLEPVTIAENLRRSDCPSAVNARKTHCPKCGAEYTGIDHRGDRFCRRCKNEWTTRKRSTT